MQEKGNLSDKIRADASIEYPEGSLHKHLLLPKRYQQAWLRNGFDRYKWNFLVAFIAYALLLSGDLISGEASFYVLTVIILVVLAPALYHRFGFLYWFDLHKQAKSESQENYNELDGYAQKLQGHKRNSNG